MTLFVEFIGIKFWNDFIFLFGLKMLEFIVVENVGMSLNQILLLRYFWNELNNLEIFLELMCANPTSLFLVLLMPWKV